MQLGIHFIDFLPGDPSNLAPTLVATAKTAVDIGATVFTLAETAVDIGATVFTLADHFFQMEGVGRAQDPFLEGMSLFHAPDGVVPLVFSGGKWTRDDEGTVPCNLGGTVHIKLTAEFPLPDPLQ